jgi:hypothetical protein
MIEATLPQNSHPEQNSFQRLHLSMKGSMGSATQIVTLWCRLKQQQHLNILAEYKPNPKLQVLSITISTHYPIIIMWIVFQNRK